MKYKIHRLDGRFSYRKWFGYYIGFTGGMANGQGPLHFNDALKWFMETYGWSAEIREYAKMHAWTISSTTWALGNYHSAAAGILEKLPDHCNPHWSWTNGYDDLRIYVATDAELAFFQLKHSQEQQ
jgi:hypothetical protein